MGEYEHDECEDWDPRLDFDFNLRRIDTRTRMRVIHNLLKDGERGGLVLICGCGVGVECEALRNQGRDVVGLDINREAIRVASSNVSGVSFIIGDATRLPFKDESFAQTICSAVLEHIPNDKNAILEMQRTLRKGGRLAITTPRRKHSKSHACILREVEEKFGHVREGYTVNDIEVLIRNERLRILKVRFYWGPLHWLILKLFERTRNIVGKATSQELDAPSARSLVKALRRRAVNVLILFLTAVSCLDDFVPFDSPFRSGLGMLMERM